tara:strand:+ start:333 stop:620 length:288 start_codon:yes stop_codon:yes gene_type:complete
MGNKKKVIKLLFSSSEKNKQSGWEYFIDDKKVSELEYYELNHLKNYSSEELIEFHKELEKQEPADMKLYQDWKFKISIVKDLISTKENDPFFLFI